MLPEAFGAVRRLAISVGAGDDEQTLFGSELRDGIFGQIVDGGSEAVLPGFLNDPLGQLFGIAGL